MTDLQPKLIEGGFFEDQRGRIDFVNDFDASLVKRFYFTTHPDINVVRAWQGHKVEYRWFMCLAGSFDVRLVRIDNWQSPKTDLPVQTFSISENRPQTLFIPNGYVNGFKAKEPNSKLMIMSNYRLGEIADDQVRFPSDKWTDWNK